MQYRLVELIDNDWITTVVPESDAVACFEVKGYPRVGTNINNYNREELQGRPTFKGLAGPMWDGDAIRYENWAACDVLSN